MLNTTIAKMLTENTGTNFLDSGGENGRNWQRNKGRTAKDFNAEPAATVDFKYGIEVTLNVYHWLADRVTLSTPMNLKFGKFCAKAANKDKGWLELTADWLDSMSSSNTGEDGPRGIYGDGSPMSINTYNGECLLSQTLQYTFFTLDHTAYVILQIHGGADVRGGYTKPRVFEVNGDGESMFDQAHANIYCTGDNCEANWYTDDGCHWYRDGSCGAGAGTQLEAYDRASEDNGDQWTEGVLFVKSDRSALCPCCGSALKASATPGG